MTCVFSTSAVGVRVFLGPNDYVKRVLVQMAGHCAWSMIDERRRVADALDVSINHAAT